MKGLIISGAKISDYKLLRDKLTESDFVVCADGGASSILKLDIYPDLVIGDLDSLASEELEDLRAKGIKILKYPVKKDETDTELCIDYLLENGVLDITLMGVVGTRLDHSLANIYLLKKIYDMGGKGKIVDKFNTLHYVKTSIKMSKNKDCYVSIIPISPKGILISLSGFLYSLDKEILKFGSSRGISNKVIEEEACIKIYEGEAFVIESRD